MPILILLLCLVLTNCSTLHEQPTPANETLEWNTRSQALSNIQTWNLQASIAIRQLQQAWSANLVWQQQKQNYQITLFGPLGTHSYELTGQPGKVDLTLSDGQHFTANSPESLLNQQLGWELPVSHLYYWIRGLPVPTLPAEKHFDSYGHLVELTQAAWRVQFLRYTATQHIDVPNKIFIDHPPLNVKIIIHQWRF